MSPTKVAKTSEIDDDIWIQLTPGDRGNPKRALRSAPLIERIEGVVPLDDQFGVAEPKTVPNVLYEALFGQSERDAAEICAEGDASATPSLGTFAILDAAKVPNLPEMLLASGLEHACLFKGAAAEELQGVAPWIVKLEDRNGFVRHLFTGGDAPWAIWDRSASIYIRSRDGLEDVRAHLRKFTKIRDEADSWFYLRIYDPRIMRAFLQRAPAFSHRILARPSPWSDLTIITCLDNRAEVARPTKDVPAETRPLLLGAEEKAVFRHLTFEARADALMAKLDKGTTVSMPADADLRAALRSTIVNAFHRMYGYGFQQPLQQERWGVWELFYGDGFERADPTLARICDTRNTSSGERFAAFQQRLAEIYT